ncbi:hypothetical protein HLB42_00960 [Deinococcus sp. D7000]|nr:hypothetical protein HLB42_00960 [Deinococcus sp. D7000]
MLYARLTKLALNHSHLSEEAWSAAVQILAEQGVGTASSRAKGCPRAAFIGLASHGFINGFSARSPGPLNQNAQHALSAYRLYLSDPSLLNRKSDWWQAVAAERQINRKRHNGVLDVVSALIENGAFASVAATPVP